MGQTVTPDAAGISARSIANWIVGELAKPSSRARGLGPALARCLLRLAGWRVVGQLPELVRAVIIFAPHTSNWDFPILLLARAALGRQVRYFAKHSLFRWPYGALFRWTGGMPVNRSEHLNLVEHAVEHLRTRHDFLLALAPEGTRAKTDHWKSGFYRIALGAHVPVALAYIDAVERECGVGPVLELSGNVARDLEQIRSFYAGKRGIRPHLASDIRFQGSDHTASS
jgi:hypothetical protein